MSAKRSVSATGEQILVQWDLIDLLVRVERFYEQARGERRRLEASLAQLGENFRVMAVDEQPARARKTARRIAEVAQALGRLVRLLPTRAERRRNRVRLRAARLYLSQLFRASHGSEEALQAAK